MTRPHPFLRLGIAVPVLYFGTLLVAAASWPGYSHVTQYASELGSAAAPRPWIFNLGIIVMGGVTVLAALGLGATLRRLTQRALPSVLAGVFLALFGVSMIMGGSFPMPNPLHGGFGLGLALPLVPVCMAIALGRTPDSQGLRRLLWLSAVFMIVMLAVMMGVGQLVRRANVGLWQRANALSMFPWIAAASVGLESLARRAAAPRMR